MVEKVIIDLVYIGQMVDEKGSPHTIEEKEQSLKADHTDKFSSFYYSDNERNMRLSKNFIIPKFLTKDKIKTIDSESYNCELMYVDFDNNRYKIKNILKNKSSYLTCILDTEQIIK